MTQTVPRTVVRRGAPTPAKPPKETSLEEILKTKPVDKPKTEPVDDDPDAHLLDGLEDEDLDDEDPEEEEEEEEDLDDDDDADEPDEPDDGLEDEALGPAPSVPVFGVPAVGSGLGAGARAPTSVGQIRQQQEVAREMATLDDFMHHIANLSFEDELHEVTIRREEPQYDALGRKCAGYLTTFHKPVTLEEIKQRFGGGTFTAMILRKLPNGQKRIAGQRKFEVAGEPKLPDNMQAFATAAGMRGPSPAESEVIKKVLDSKDKDIQRLLEKNEQMQQQWLANMGKSDNSFVQLASTLLNKPDPTPNLLLTLAQQTEKRAADERERDRKQMENQERIRLEQQKLEREREEKARMEANSTMSSMTQMLVVMMQQQAQQAQQQMQMQMQQQQQQTQMLMALMQNSNAEKAQLAAEQMKMMQENMKLLVDGGRGTRKGGDDEDFLQKMVRFKQAMEVLSPGGGDSVTPTSVVDKLADVATQVAPGLLAAFASRNQPALPPAAPAPAPQPTQPTILPGSVAVVDIDPKEIPPAARMRLLAAKKQQAQPAPAQAPAPAQPASNAPSLPKTDHTPEEMQAVKQNIVDTFNPDEPYKLPVGEDLEGQVRLLVVNIEKGVRKGATPQGFFDEVVRNFPATTVSLLKLAPLDAIYDKLGEAAPMEWEINSIKGQNFIRDLLAIAKR